MVFAILFIVIAVLLCVAAVMAVFGVTHLAMSGSEAVERDGLHRGTPAPRWSLPDAAGQVRSSPPARGFQLIVFGDHGLKSFTELIAGIQELLTESGLEVIILPREKNNITVPLLGMLGLEGAPVVAGSPSLYGRYNVRVTPFLIFVGPDGLVRGSSLVNHRWQLMKLWQLARVPLDAAAPPLVNFTVPPVNFTVPPENFTVPPPASLAAGH
jgi:hypothetical protein